MIDEQAVQVRLAQIVRRELGIDGLDVLGQVDVQVYRRWDRRNAQVIIKAEVAPREPR